MTKQDRSARPLSKTAILIAERAARKAARETKRISDASRLVAAREKASALAKAMPVSFSEWGVTRTRAYVHLLEIIQSKAENVTMTPERLEGYLSQMENVATWSLEYCLHLSLLHARAADIGAPETTVVQSMVTA